MPRGDILGPSGQNILRRHPRRSCCGWIDDESDKLHARIESKSAELGVSIKDYSSKIDQLIRSRQKDFEKTLLGKIQESNEKLNGDIDAAVMDMMLYLKQKMEANQDFLESELARRKQECDETVQALRNRADDVIADLDSMESALEQAASEVFAEAERILEACMKTEDWLNENEWAWDVV